jgi:hypothetical protein
MTPLKNIVTLTCLASFSYVRPFCAKRRSTKQKLSFLVRGNHLRQLPIFAFRTLWKTPLYAHALYNFQVYDLFVSNGGRQNKNYHFWCRGTISGNSWIFQFVPSKKRGCAHMACIIFLYMAFLCHEEVAKTKIIIFGAGEPHQAISEFSSLCTANNTCCAHCLAQFS